VSTNVKRAAPLELFFDLVFVFAITQIVSLVVNDLTWTGMFHGSLVLALLWWAWSRYTWTANSIDLESRFVRIAFLAAMVVIFVMAQAVPLAFEGQGHWLAFGYVIIRAIAFVISFRATAIGPAQL
jgi:low temperature requirement protein LtrA